jgi:hypothetical protein
MAPNEELDDISEFESKETSRAFPVGYGILYFGLIAWGLWYLWAYSPWSTGWTQVKDLEGGPSGSNVFFTIAFTVIPATAALFIWLGQKGKRRG